MSVSGLVLCAAVLLLHHSGAQSLPSPAACPMPCLCQRGSLLNCSSVGLSNTPLRIPATITALDLSHNGLCSLPPFRPGHGDLGGLLHLWVGYNRVENLSLCEGRNRGGTKTPSRGRDGCVSWIPALQLLSAERNQLRRLPEGLGASKSLQVLQLSYNQISKLGPADLHRCAHLRELYLQHNRLSSVHPLAFRDLPELQILDLSFNLLTTIPPPAYLSLRSLNAQVDVMGNRWRCDCKLRSVKRWLDFDRGRSHSTWNVVCATPSRHTGKELLKLEDSDLTCPSPEYSSPGFHQDVSVNEGMEVLLPCSNHDQDDSTQARWWTPQGQASGGQKGLLIRDITEQDAGLYVCISGLHDEHVSVFDLNVGKMDRDTRLRREAQSIGSMPFGEEQVSNQRNIPIPRQAIKTHSEFVLAVCLSVFITFILAFILGVLLRPLLDQLWRRIRHKKDSSLSPSNSISSSTGPSPHVNRGFSERDELEQEVRGGGRVTFGEVSEARDQGSSVTYYDTVGSADGFSASYTEAEIIYESIQRSGSLSSSGEVQRPLEVEEHRTRADDSDSSSLQDSQEARGNPEPCLTEPQGKTQPVIIKAMEYEPIPDLTDTMELEERNSSSASSHSDQDTLRVTNRKPAVDTPAEPAPNAVDEKNRVPGFTSKPMADWPQNVNNPNPLDPELWNDSGESFTFTDGSARSSSRDLSGPKLANLLKEDACIPVRTEAPDVSMKGEDSASESQVDSFEQNPFSEDPIRQFLEEEGVSVNEIKQDVPPSPDHLENSDRSSSCSSNTSGEGPTEYTVNPESEEEEEPKIHNTYVMGNDITVQSEDTLASYDLTSKPAAIDTFFRQDTITLDPSDIHMTFTRYDSFDQGPFDEVPTRKYPDEEGSSMDKMKQEFSPTTDRSAHSDRSRSSSDDDGTPAQYNPHTVYRTRPDIPPLSHSEHSDRSSSSISSDDEERPTKYPHHPRRLEIKVEPEIQNGSRIPDKATISPVSGDLSIKNPDTVLDINFDNSASSTDMVENTGSVEKRGWQGFKARLSSKFRGGAEKEERDLQPPVQISNPYPPSAQIGKWKGFSLDQLTLPKKARFFSTPESQPPTQKPSPPPTQGRRTPEAEPEPSKSSLSFSSKDSISTDGDMNVSLDQPPMPKKSLLFSTSDPHPPTQKPSTPPTLGRLTAEVEPEPRRSSLSSQSSVSTDSEGSGGGIDQLPKPKKSLLFSTSDPQLLTPPTQKTSPPLTKSGQTPVAEPHFSSKDTISTDGRGSGDMNFSFDQLPKPKKSLLFSTSDPQPLTPPRGEPPPPPSQDRLTPEAEPRRSSFSSQSSVSTDNQGSGRHMIISLDQLPKPKKSLLFSTYDPHPPTQKPSTPPTLGRLTAEAEPEPRRSSLSSQSSVSTDSEGSGGGMNVSIDQLPKPKKSLLFSTSDPQLLTHPTQKTSPPLTKSGQTPVAKPHFSSKDTISTDGRGSGDMNFSFDQLPKPKKSLLFSTSDPQPLTPPRGEPPPPPSQDRLTPEAEPRRSSFSSQSSVSTDNEGSGRHMIISLDQLPKPKKSLLFSTYDPHPPTQKPSTPPTLGRLTAEAEPEPRRSSLSSQSSVSTDSEGSGGGMNVSIDQLPKPKKSLLFSTSDPQLLTHPTQKTSPPLTKSGQTPVAKPHFSSKDTINTDGRGSGDMNFSFDQLPKPKKSLLFSTSDPQPLTPPREEPPPPPNQDRLTPAAEPRRSSLSSQSSVSTDSEGSGGGIDQLPKPKKSLLFSTSDPQLLTPPTQKTSPPLTKSGQTPVAKPHFSSKDTINTDGRGSGDMNFSFDQLPKPKKSLLFSTSDPQPPTKTASFPPTQRGHRPGAEPEPNKPSLSVSSKDSISTDGRGSGEINFSFDQLPKPKKSLLFSTSDPQLLTPTQKPSPPPTDGRLTAEAEPEPRRPRLSSQSSVSTDSEGSGEETGLSLNQQPKPKKSLLFSTSVGHSGAGKDPDPLSISQPRRRLVVDIQPPQTAPPEVPGRPLPSPDEKDATGPARSSQGRPKQDWRKGGVFQQRKRVMDGFTISSQSSESQGGDREGGTSLAGYAGAIPFHSKHTYRNVTTSHTENMSVEVSDTADLSVNMSSLRSKSALRFGINKERSDV